MDSITWRQVDKYHVVSACGEYRISKAFMPDGPRYIPYRIIAGQNPTILSNALNTVGAAKQICETDKKLRTNGN